MSCKDCRGGGGALRVNDVWKLYHPDFSVKGSGGSGGGCDKTKIKPRAKFSCANSCEGKLSVIGKMRPCEDQTKGYWSKNCDVSLIRRYEEQPWFRNRLVQAEWKNFVDQLVTPANIGCRLCPGPDDWQFKCHKARALVGPKVPCVWELPEQDQCSATQYGYNRDWRRYNEDERIEASDIRCGCNDQPLCCPKEKRSEGPPYLGKKFGARYMSWAYPNRMMFPTTQVYKYQSLPKC